MPHLTLTPYTATDYAQAIKALLPPGAAWDWPQGGLGATMLHGTAEELARLDRALPDVLRRAIEIHQPAASSWHIREYRKLAEALIAGVVERMPRKTFRVGSCAGERLWGVMITWAKSPRTIFAVGSPAGGLLWTGRVPKFDKDFPVKFLQLDHLIQPFRVGSGAGEGCYGHRARYILRVRYYQSVVNIAPIASALQAFAQSHVFLWFEDITGQGGFYAQD